MSLTQNAVEVATRRTLRTFAYQFSVTAAKAVAAAAAGVLAAVTDTGVAQTITSGLTNPAVPRNITATSGGTAGDIAAVQVIVAGTNFFNEAITETLPVFTENSATTVVGNKAFKTVTSVTIPAHDGTAATTSIGWGDKLGLHHRRAFISCVSAFLNNVLESTAAVLTFSATAIESNTIDLNSALNGTKVDAHLIV